MTLLFNGLVIGSIYGLLAASFALVLRATGVLNLMNVGFFVVAPFLMWEATGGRKTPLPSFLMLVIVVCIVLGALAWMVQRIAMRPLQDAPFFALVIATLALDTSLLALAAARDDWRMYPREVGSPWPGETLTILGGTIPKNGVLVLATAAAAIGLVMLLVGRSRWGLAFQGASMHREAAASIGISLARVTSLSWIAGAALAAVGGILLATDPRLVSLDTIPGVAFRALPAAIIGGTYSIHGAALGGLLVGVVEVLVARYGGGVFGDNSHFLAAYILMMLVLILTREGLFGRRTVERV